MKAFTKRALLIGAYCSASFAMAGAAHADTQTANGEATIVGAITLTPVDPLRFGRFASNGTGNTAVEVYVDGTVGCSGASLCGGGTTSAASFDVTASPNMAMTISTPGNFFLYDGPNSVEIGNIVFFGTNVTQVSYNNSSAVSDASGDLHFKMRAALWMLAGTPGGNFTGTFPVSVEYQ
ncbi:MAG: DUF4402 domain-containing protein [Sphingomonadales bacterium]|nr:DUF4402 domain-containing protein [Sphingomonadales bacterium]